MLSLPFQRDGKSHPVIAAHRFGKTTSMPVARRLRLRGTVDEAG